MDPEGDSVFIILSLPHQGHRKYSPPHRGHRAYSPPRRGHRAYSPPHWEHRTCSPPHRGGDRGSQGPSNLLFSAGERADLRLKPKKTWHPVSLTVDSGWGSTCAFLQMRSEGTEACAVKRQKLQGHCVFCSLSPVYSHMTAIPHPVTVRQLSPAHPLCHSILSIFEARADLQDGVSHQPPAAQALCPSCWQAGLCANQPLECPHALLVPTL